jgi:hypothetical protein
MPAEQLRHLLTVGARPSVRVQVLGLATPRMLLTGSFAVLSFADLADTGVASFYGVRGQVVRQEREAEARATLAGFDQLSGGAVAIRVSRPDQDLARAADRIDRGLS